MVLLIFVTPLFLIDFFQSGKFSIAVKNLKFKNELKEKPQQIE